MAYTTEAKVESYLGETFDATSTPTPDDVTNFIAWADSLIDAYTGTKFASTTVTDEYLDSYGETRFRLPKRPIISVTNFYVDEAGGLGASSTSWVARTEGRTNSDDFVVLKDEGVLHFHSDIPPAGIQNIKTTYVYGYSSAPTEVEYLSTLLVAREIVKARLADNSFGSQSGITVGPIRIDQKNSEASVGLKELDKAIEEAWKAVGQFRTIAW